MPRVYSNIWYSLHSVWGPLAFKCSQYAWRHSWLMFYGRRFHQVCFSGLVANGHAIAAFSALAPQKQMFYRQGLTRISKEWAGWCAWEVYQTISLPRISHTLWFHYLGLFQNLHHHKVSYLLITSKLMHQFYLQCAICKWLGHWVAERLLSLLEN